MIEKEKLITEAVIFAAEAHDGMKRRGKDIPYILHPLEVLTIVAGLTDDMEVMAAAVLHDTIEDTGVRREDIADRFGERVAALAASESENKREDRPAEETWQVRKQETIDHIASAERDVKLICLGDKLANIRELARDHDRLGDALWERFNQKDKKMHGWYYGSICSILEKEFAGTPAVEEYRRLHHRVFDL